MQGTIYLIRHGQTEWNVQRRMQGRMDSPLTEEGILNAERLAPALPQMDAIYCSPAGRAHRTAELVFGNVPFQFEERLQEIDMGDWEGRLQAELDVEAPGDHRAFWEQPHRYHRSTGETYADVAERSIACFHEIAARHPNERIAVVSHTIVIRSILFSIEPREPADFWAAPAIYPTSVSVIEHEGGNFGIQRFGCMAHSFTQPNGLY